MTRLFYAAATGLVALSVQAGSCGFALPACGGRPERNPSEAPTTSPTKRPSVNRSPFGRTAERASVELFTLTNANGMEVRTMSYGASIVSLRVPDRNGQLGDVVLGFDTFDEYVTKKPPYFGAIVGRYGNRIAKGSFTLDGKTYPLATNNGPNHLHGGVKGFDKLVWRGEPFERDGNVGVAFTLTSPDGDEGYPGTLTARVTYTLSGAKNELTVD